MKFCEAPSDFTHIYSVESFFFIIFFFSKYALTRYFEEGEGGGK